MLNVITYKNTHIFSNFWTSLSRGLSANILISILPIDIKTCWFGTPINAYLKLLLIYISSLAYHHVTDLIRPSTL